MSFTRRQLKKVSRFTAASAMVLVAGSLSVQAEEMQQFNIAAQPVSKALIEFSLVTGVDVVVSSGLVKGQNAPALVGAMTAREGLERLVAGTGLQVEETSDGALKLVRQVSDAGEANTAEEDVSFVLEEIIVTAEKRAESLQDIPIAISAFSGERMKSAGVEGVYSLKQLAPSLQVGGGFTANTFVSIRGIGSEVPSIGGEAGVAIAQDGVVFGRAVFFDADFLDTERVEVLRGPQGTISGRNATGGGINIYSRRPTEEFEAGLKVTIGNYDRFATEGYLSGPLIEDKISARIAFSTDDADGWIKNTYLDEEIETRNKVHARASFLVNASDNLEALLVFEAINDKSTPQGALSLGKVRPSLPSQEEFFNVKGPDLNNLEYEGDLTSFGAKEQYGATMGLTWDVSSFVTLKSTTGYWSVNMEGSSDYDGIITPLNQNPFYLYDVEQFTQELTLTADLTDRLDLILGGLYLDDRAKHALTFVSEPTGIQSYEVDIHQNLVSYSAYGQLRYRLTDDLRISAGVRYTHDKKNYADHQIYNNLDLGPISDEKAWNAITPRVAIDYAVNDDLTLFVNVAKGFKAGGFATYASPIDEFNPEYVWNYEAGLKASLLGDRLRGSITGFYADYTDLQQNVFGNKDSVLPTIENAARAKISGLEFEVEALVSNELRLNTALTWLDAKFKDLHTSDSIFPELGEFNPTTGLNVRDLSGNRLARSPEWQFNIGLEYSVPVFTSLVTTLRADYQWQDRMFFSFFNHDAVSQDSYGLLNLQVSLSDDRDDWQLTAFVRNVFDERYLSTVHTSGLIIPTIQGDIGEPRMYGVSLAYNF